MRDGSQLKIRRLALSPLVAGVALFAAQAAMAHGWLEQPAGRALLCNKGANPGCSFYPNGMETGDGSDSDPFSGLKAGQYGSANRKGPAAMDEQTADKWKKVDINPGPNKFIWHITANHSTKDLKFFITKKGWNPNAALTRDQFDSTPFCKWEGVRGAGWYNDMLTLDGNGNNTVQCNVPSDRSGYNVIMAMWDVHDTPNTFYNVADVNIKGGSVVPDPEWKSVGTIRADEHLR